MLYVGSSWNAVYQFCNIGDIDYFILFFLLKSSLQRNNINRTSCFKQRNHRIKNDFMDIVVKIFGLKDFGSYVNRFFINKNSAYHAFFSFFMMWRNSGHKNTTNTTNIKYYKYFNN